MRELTEQERFSSGTFGNDYADRCQGDGLIAANTVLFGKALARTRRLESALELGTYIGNNLVALQRLLPDCAFNGVEINDEAHAQAQGLGGADVWHGSLIAEYYDPSPVEVSYHGHSGKLFKRDFAGEMLDRYSDLQRLDYGFTYHRDPQFPADDVTWFLLEKRA